MGPSRVLSVMPRDGPGVPRSPLTRDASGAHGVNGPTAARPPEALPAPLSVQAAHASPFARLLRGLATEIDGGEARVHHAVNSAAASKEGPRPIELLALQASLYRYSEALDLAARLVDRAATSVKTVLQGQQ